MTLKCATDRFENRTSMIYAYSVEAIKCVVPQHVIGLG